MATTTLRLLMLHLWLSAPGSSHAIVLVLSAACTTNPFERNRARMAPGPTRRFALRTLYAGHTMMETKPLSALLCLNFHRISTVRAMSLVIALVLSAACSTILCEPSHARMEPGPTRRSVVATPSAGLTPMATRPLNVSRVLASRRNPWISALSLVITLVSSVVCTSLPSAPSHVPMASGPTRRSALI